MWPPEVRGHFCSALSAQSTNRVMPWFQCCAALYAARPQTVASLIHSLHPVTILFIIHSFPTCEPWLLMLLVAECGGNLWARRRMKPFHVFETVVPRKTTVWVTSKKAKREYLFMFQWKRPVVAAGHSYMNLNLTSCLASATFLTLLSLDLTKP